MQRLKTAISSSQQKFKTTSSTVVVTRWKSRSTHAAALLVLSVGVLGVVSILVHPAFLDLDTELILEQVDIQKTASSSHLPVVTTAIITAPVTAQTDGDSVVSNRNNAIAVSLPPLLFYSRPLNGTTQQRHRPTDHRISLIVQNGGEMGNCLCHLAAAREVQIKAAQERNITLEIIIWSSARRFKSTFDTINQCFPKLRNVDFLAVDPAELKLRKIQQVERFGQETARILKLQADGSREAIDLALATLQQIMVNQTNFFPHANATISLPHLQTGEYQCLVSPEIRPLFDFDYAQCCGILPHPDEIIFHYRNFKTELGGTVPDRYRELTPNQTARVIFKNMEPGTRIAVLSRYPAPDHIMALTQRGFQVRQVAQSFQQDFCFILHAQKGIVGTWHSTFVKWAARLNKYQAPVLLYSFRSARFYASAGAKSYETNQTWFDSNQSGIRFVTIPKTVQTLE